MFKELLKTYEDYDNSREKVILGSREIVRLSKKVISAIHRDNIKEAEVIASKMKEKITNMQKEKGVTETGSASHAMQEYIEAILLLEFAKTGKVMPHSKINSTPEEYIMGLCDFVGELQRRSVLKVSKGDTDEIRRTYKIVSNIYDGLLDFSFRGETRKKFDLVKYVMIRLEEIMLELKLK